MEIVGKATINPVLFYSGKISGFSIWTVLFFPFVEVDFIEINSSYIGKYFALFFFLFGLFLSIVSFVNLGKSTRMGLPSEKTVLKTRGIYRLSRNPMYVGFNLITIASMVFSLNVFVIILGTYSLIVNHFIIKGEELFLIKIFGQDYNIYVKKVRRYL